MEVGARPHDERRNVGTIDAYIRITAGLLLLAAGTMGRLGRIMSPIAMVIGAGKVAEGITRYCPLNDWLGFSTVEGTKGFGRVRLQDTETAIEGAETLPRDFPWEPSRQS